MKLLLGIYRSITDIIMILIDIFYITRKHAVTTEFNLNSVERQRLADWQQAQPGECVLITYSTPIGVQIKVKNQITGSELDITDYSSW